MKLIPKNWAVFQHYKDRCPPWIKLHRELLNDRVFMCLPLASKALAPLLWLLASESKDGSFDAEIDELQFRLRIDHKDLVDGLKPLIDKGFFCDASGALAQRLHVAIPETEGKTETETETKPEKKAARKRAAKTTMPENFSVSDRVATWARHNGHHRIDEHLEVFKRKCIAKGYTYASWDDAFMEAIRQDWAGLRGKTAAQPISFAQQDEQARRRRWEEMTGRKWPTDGPMPEFIDVATVERIEA